jgi:hypothetical protein
MSTEDKREILWQHAFSIQSAARSIMESCQKILVERDGLNAEVRGELRQMMGGARVITEKIAAQAKVERL